MILEKTPGRDLRYELPTMSHAQMTKVAQQIVFFQRKVATLPIGKGFGYVPIGEQGAFSSWKKLLQYEMNKSTYNTSNEVIGRWGTRLGHIFSRFEPYLAQVHPSCFLDDLSTKNVIVLNGDLQGLVDFDCVCYGDPLWMIGLTQTAIVSDIGPQELFYVDELCRIWGLTDKQRTIVDFYAVIHAIEFMERLMTKEDREWVERMTDVVEQWMTGIESAKTNFLKEDIST